MSLHDPDKPATALGYSIVINLDGNRQVTAQCFVAEDEDDSAINSKFDRVFAILDRQKARYDIVNEREELAKETGTLDQLKEDLARVDHDFDKAQAALDLQMIEMQEQNKGVFEAGYNEHIISGRRGEYVPKGFAAQQARATEAALANVTADKAKNNAEREQHRQGVLISVERYDKAIAQRRHRIVELEKLLG